MKKRSSLLFFSLMIFAGSEALSQSNSTYSWNNLPQISKPSFKADTVSIVKFGATPDGVSLNTKAINEAIESTSRKGGGVVLVPQGLWLTGPVYLKSNVNLHLAKNATLLFTDDKTQYKLTEGIYEGRSVARNESPISGIDLENVGITGFGVIDGNGDAWRAVHKSQLTESEWKTKVASGGVLKDDGKTWYPSEQFKKAATEGKSMLLVPGKPIDEFADMKDYLRPNLVVIRNSKKVLLEGITFQNSGAWCLHPLMCEDLTLKGLTIKNPDYSHNGDGIDVESCKNFQIEDCVLDVGDDAICIKSGKDEEGRKRGIPTENGVIRNNLIYAGHGGFVVGSEMSGGARNIFVENCTFVGTDKGLRFKSVRGRGGVVEHIYARNIFMKDIVDEAIFFDMYYFVKFATDSDRDMRPEVNEGTPVFRNMKFENIVCNGAKKGVFVRGLPEMPIQNIVMENMVLKTDTGIELIETKDIQIRKAKLIAKKTDPVILVENSNTVEFDQIDYEKGAKSLFSINGKNTRNVTIGGTDLTKAGKDITLDKGATSGAVNHKGKK